MRMRIVVSMVERIMHFSVKDIDDCRKDFVVMMMGYDSMSQYRNIGKQYKEYGYRSFHVIL